MREHLEFYLHGYVFIACGALIWALVHETAKALWKELLVWLWPKVFKRPYPIPYK